VGLATAQELTWRHPHLKVLVIEKEAQVATHQTGHNSGVVHAGIYYKPGSLMAQLCVEGMKRTYAYCDEHRIPYKKVGKLVVATNALEEARLLDLWARATQNNVPGLELVGPEGIRAREPACQVRSEPRRAAVTPLLPGRASNLVPGDGHRGLGRGGAALRRRVLQ